MGKINDYIRYRRIIQKMSQMDVAHKASMKYSTYCKKESGNGKFYFDEVLRIAKAIGISNDEIIDFF